MNSKKIVKKHADEHKQLMKPQDFDNDSYELDVESKGVIKAIGYGTDHQNNKMRLMEFERKAPGKNDVVIEILYCGVCHSDFHVILNEWKNTKYPIIAGHEIVGIISKIGNSVKNFKVGDYAGLGTNFNSCKSCNSCKKNDVEYCEYGVTETYNSPDRKYEGELYATGDITQGGYSNVIVANENYLITLPKKSKKNLAEISPLLCAGVTVYNPLKFLLDKKGPKARVGIAGVGGLGSTAIKIGKALGLEVIALTRTEDKLENCIELGADEALLATDLDVMKLHNNTFDMILCTIPFPHDSTPYIHLLKMKGIM